MRFFTEQDKRFLKNQDVLTASTAFEDEYLTKAYPFMKKAYRERINPNFSDKQALIWGWPSRSEAFWYYQNMPKSKVIIEAEIPDSEVLVSDFFIWHLVLNNISPEFWQDIFSEQALRKDGLLLEDESFTPQLVTDHIDRKNIIDVFY